MLKINYVNVTVWQPL